MSVIIPTYGHRSYVAQTLESVFAQTAANFEVIVVNDGSPDDTAAVLSPYAAAGRIRYVEQTNAGQAAARNRGLAEARGEFIAFLDDDDLWPPDKLAWQLQILSTSSPSTVAVVGRCDFIGDRLHAMQRPLVRLPASLTAEDLVCANVIISPGQTLIRADAIRAIGGFGHIKGGADDWDCYLRLIKRGNFICRDEVALLYRVHSNNASKNATSMLKSARCVARAHSTFQTEPSRGMVMRSILRVASPSVAQQGLRALGRGDISTFFGSMSCLGRCVATSGYDWASGRIAATAVLDAFAAAAKARLPFGRRA